MLTLLHLNSKTLKIIKLKLWPKPRFKRLRHPTRETPTGCPQIKNNKTLNEPSS